MDQQRIAEPWTAGRVEARLIAAFRIAPGRPMLASSDHLEHGLDGRQSAMTDALSWTRRFVDRRDGLILMTWARCVATREPFAEQCRGWGWNRSTAEAARRRATAQIVAGLNSEQQELDNRKTRIGASARNEDVILAHA